VLHRRLPDLQRLWREAARRPPSFSWAPAVRGGVKRGIFNLGTNYIECVAVNLATNCLVKASM
jgi:hypothetical protein